MTQTITRSDLCQGHGGSIDCTWHPETGDCDHGTVSYCDGSCASALEAWQDELTRNRSLIPLAVEGRVTLDVYGNGVAYRVVFEGQDAEAWAIAYIEARPGLHFMEAVDAPNEWPALSDAFAELLYPTCRHGMSADMCMDPYGENHFGTREQELANGW